MKEKVSIAALDYLVSEKELKEKTKKISYTSLKMRNYLPENDFFLFFFIKDYI